MLLCKRRICKTCPVCKTKIKMFYFASVTLNFTETLLSELQKFSVILHGTVQCRPTTSFVVQLHILHCLTMGYRCNGYKGVNFVYASTQHY